jgi:DNA modification methylase
MPQLWKCKAGKVALCDYMEFIVSLPDGSVDACITDPPYGRKYLNLYRGLLDQVGRVIKPGGSLLCIIPQYAYPELFKMETPYLSWRWPIDMRQTTGAFPRLVNRKRTLIINGKSIGWWTRDPWPEPDYSAVFSGFDNDYVPKALHQWEQAETWAAYCLDNFSKPGEVVLDPFCGAGTLPVVAKKMGRQFLACDNDPAALETTVARIKEAACPTR